MKSADKKISVLFVGDSRSMKGGVSAVIRCIESSPLWQKYHCHWLECQINASLGKKLTYLIRALFQGIYLIPRYRIVHFHTAVGNSMKVQLPFFLYARLLRKKIIVHLHVGDQLKDAVGNRFFRFFCIHADKVLTLGNSLQKYVPARSDRTDHVDFLYNPAPEPKRREKPEPYFLFAAYFDSQMNKGYDVLLEAFSKTIKVHPEWKLILCGDGDMERVRQLIDRFQLGDSVSTPGWVSGQVKESYFSHAFAYCLCSRQEGLPITILEALAYGLPILTTPVGCLPEILTDEENALFFQVGNPDQLARQMCRLIEDPEIYEALSRKAKRLAEGPLSQACFLEKLDHIYQSLA